MFLLIRNPQNNTGFGKPVELVKEAIAEIVNPDNGKELSDITVIIILPGGCPQDSHSSSVHLELAHFRDLTC